MDDECVDGLGRPISSLKVSELRDELAKRALIKTGKKNELIDRLRQAISKQSISPQQSASSQPANLTVQQTGDHIDAAIDYSTQQAQQTNMASSQQQVPLVAADVVDYSAARSSAERHIHDEVLQQEQELKQQDDPIVTQRADEELREAELKRQQFEQNENEQRQAEQKALEDQRIQDEVERQRPDKAETVLIETQRQQELELSQETTDQQKAQDAELKPDVQAPADDTRQDTETIEGSSDIIDSIAQSDSAKEESATTAPVTFTLKRGNRDAASSSKLEKRRKWSGKSESSQISDSPLVSGGISSQKLQELINLKQSSEIKVKEDVQKPSAIESKPEANVESKMDADAQPQTAENLKERTKSLNKESTRDEAASKVETRAEEKPNEKPTQSSASTSEKESEPTCWLVIKNLTRPLKIDQLEAELKKYGLFVEDKFWVEKLKSKCCVLYETVEAAQHAKESLHNKHWPISNPKTLVVEYITEEIYKDYLEAENRPAKEPESSRNNSLNGNAEKSNKKSNDRISDRLDAGDVGASSIRSRLGEKLSVDAKNSNNANRLELIDSQPRELDELFRKTKAQPQLFWLPLDESQAEARKADRGERDRRAQEAAAASSRRSPPQPTNRRRSPAHQARRSPPRHRSPARRSPIRGRRSPARRRTPPPPQQPSRRSPARRRPPPPTLDSPPPRRRSPLRDQSPLLRRRPSPRDVSPPIRRRASPHRNSPPFRRRTPLRDSPQPRRRSPSPLLRRRSPPRDSPPIRRRSPEPSRRSPPGAYGRRSPDMLRRSPGPIRRMSPGRRSPDILRSSPGMMRRSPGPIRRSPGFMRRSPGPIRRSPGPIRRSPGPMRRSPGPIRRPRGARDYD